MNSDLLSRLEVATGKVSPQRATILCGVDGYPPADGWSLTGKVIGPYSALGSTLPASFALRDLGPGASVLAQASVLDPICCTPELPAYYQIELELRKHGEVLATSEERYGIRWVEARDGAFYWQGRRSIPRGLTMNSLDLSLSVAHECEWTKGSLACVVDNPDEMTVAWTGLRQPFPLLANWNPWGRPLADALRMWAKTGQVLAALIDADENVDRKLLPPRSSIFLAADLWKQDTLSIPDWADAIGLREEQVSDLVKLEQASGKTEDRPVLVFSQRDHGPDLESIRAACDQLRADLAPVRQCAGYFLRGRSNLFTGSGLRSAYN